MPLLFHPAYPANPSVCDQFTTSDPFFPPCYPCYPCAQATKSFLSAHSIMTARVLFNDNLRYNKPYTIEMRHDTKEYVLKNREYSVVGSRIEKHFKFHEPGAIFLYDDKNRPTTKATLRAYQAKLDVILFSLREYKNVTPSS